MSATSWRLKITKKIFRAIFLVALGTVIACLVLVMGALFGVFSNMMERQLRDDLDLAVQAYEELGQPYLAGLRATPSESNARFTLVAPDGAVIFDTHADAGSMDNHGDREEIQAAQKLGTGHSTRYSNTMTTATMYRARKLSSGEVLRISMDRMTILSMLLGMVQPILIVLFVALILSYVLARHVSKKLVEPINNLDLEKPLENESYEEIAPLLMHMEQQHRKIRDGEKQLAERKKEFYTIIENMNEGLVLLNKDNKIISMNPSAHAFFDSEGDYSGKDFMMLERSLDIHKFLDSAREDGSASLEESRGGRTYQLNANRIDNDSGQFSGTVILIFDNTEKIDAERHRREFTANFSHELKTPLHSIMGSAELVENGLVKKEDLPKFATRIREEASRLLTLIEDIIQLSKLDEKTMLPVEQVDLFELTASEINALAPLAEQKNIELKLEGGETVVSAVRQLVHEIVHNLCDNAIKYTNEGGSVTVKVSEEGGSGVISVSDTGIGIPIEHQPRVFERFYRVDKSHSRESGGTGLGLSIVKHAVQRMDGSIELKSTPGKGTTITVIL